MNHDDDLGLPPGRRLPPDVHDRTLSRLEAAMHDADPGSHSRSRRTALLAAAAVTVLALGVGLTVVAFPSDDARDVAVAAPTSSSGVPSTQPSPSTDPTTSPAAVSPAPTSPAPPSPAPPSPAPPSTPTSASSSTPAPPAPTPGPTRSAAPSGPGTTTAAPPPSSEPGPAFAANTDTQQAPATGGSLTVVDVRTAVQDGYERVVFELDGDAAELPGFLVGYLGGPAADPTGAPLEVAGQSFLTAFVRGVDWLEPAPGLVTGSIEGSGGIVQEVLAGPMFEGQHQLVIGLDAERPFRVRVLDGPPRVVVDILTS